MIYYRTNSIVDAQRLCEALRDERDDEGPWLMWSVAWENDGSYGDVESVVTAGCESYEDVIALLGQRPEHIECSI